jgi:hypothetical protein
MIRHRDQLGDEALVLVSLGCSQSVNRTAEPRGRD